MQILVENRGNDVVVKFGAFEIVRDEKNVFDCFDSRFSMDSIERK